jgi:hypothetical protein
MLLIKKPKWLDFVTEEFNETEITIPTKKQVRWTGLKSNAKIIKFSDGSYYMRLGNEMYPLKEVPINRGIFLTEFNESENCFVVKEEINSKYIIGTYNK